jgi:hypothetical protein
MSLIITLVVLLAVAVAVWMRFEMDRAIPDPCDVNEGNPERLRRSADERRRKDASGEGEGTGTESEFPAIYATDRGGYGEVLEQGGVPVLQNDLLDRVADTNVEYRSD